MPKQERVYQRSASSDDFHKLEQTLIIYDWDDTLCPSWWIQDNSPRLSFEQPPPAEECYIRPLATLEKVLNELLRRSMLLGKVVIVTNAIEPWVDTSSQNYLPGLEPTLDQIRVLYAREMYEEYQLSVGRSSALKRQASKLGAPAPGMFPSGRRGRKPSTDSDDLTSRSDHTTDMEASFSQEVDEGAPTLWKELAFREEIGRFYSQYENQSWKNVISIGDAIFERDALRSVVSKRPSKHYKCRTKTAKMLDDPSVDELIKQLKVMCESIEHIVKYDGNLDIELSEADIDFDMDVVDSFLAS